jgi:hypothetical protein
LAMPATGKRPPRHCVACCVVASGRRKYRFDLPRLAEPAQLSAFGEPMATVAPPDEAENLVEDDTRDRGRKEEDDERRTVVSREHLDRRSLGVLRGQDYRHDCHGNANDERDADAGASIQRGGGCAFVGLVGFWRRPGALLHRFRFEVVSHGVRLAPPEWRAEQLPKHHGSRPTAQY